MKMRGIVDEMLVVFPFEEEIYRKNGIDVQFVGHPLLEELAVEFTRDQFCKRFRINRSGKEDPGVNSGKAGRQEIENIFSVMARAAGQLQQEEACEVIVAVAPHLQKKLFETYLPSGVSLILSRMQRTKL